MLDLTATRSVAAAMEMEGIAPRSWLSSTQIGAASEALVTAGLILASRGRLAPFKPFADDNGHDLLVYDKHTRRCFPLQIKCRTALDSGRGKTVQFDVRLSTFARESDGLVLYALMDGDRVQTCWLIPASRLEAVARRSANKLVITPSPNPLSRDKYSSYRHAGMELVVRQLVGRFDEEVPELAG